MFPTKIKEAIKEKTVIVLSLLMSPNAIESIFFLSSAKKKRHLQLSTVISSKEQKDNISWMGHIICYVQRSWNTVLQMGLSWNTVLQMVYFKHVQEDKFAPWKRRWYKKKIPDWQEWNEKIPFSKVVSRARNHGHKAQNWHSKNGRYHELQLYTLGK